MDIKPIKTKANYGVTLKEVETLMSAGPDTPEGEKLDVMITSIEAYEAKHFPMDLPDPEEAIRFEMDLKRSDCKRSGADDANLLICKSCNDNLSVK